MEDVLDLYAEPYDPKRPVVCFDESPKQLVAEVQTPLPAAPGQVERYDYEYQRNGTRNLFMQFEPGRGWRHVAVTDSRTMQDFAGQMKWLSDEVHPEAELIRVVLDNLNTHRPAALYETFPPEEARRILKRLEFHYTPKHASWLNMAEIEISVLTKQCLGRRLPTIEQVQSEASQWSQDRNRKKTKINWSFKRKDAKRVFPELYRKRLAG